ncbi:alpha/beta hydrolase [Niabella terrae]
MSMSLTAQQTLPLYKIVPNSKPTDMEEKHEVGDDGILRISNVTQPELTRFQPEHPNGTAVIICPGGGYRILAFSHEGTDVAKALNQWGITAFVLKYRLPDNRSMTDKSIGPLQDAERAIQLVRGNAKKWGINPNMIGIMGFSAGGHLAASLSTRYREQLIKNPKKISFRPDFSVLGYPVISFTDSLMHKGSRENLIGTTTDPALVKKYSNEWNVDDNTPPAFLVHAKDDKGVPYKNSVIYYQQLQSHHIAAQLRSFEKGGHGFGMHNKKESGDWMADLKTWLQEQGFLPE